MPEIGDQLSLHFPCEEENESYILDSTGQSYNLTDNRLADLEMIGAIEAKGVASQTPIKKRDKSINHGPLPKYIRAPNGQELKIEQTHIIMSSAESMATLLIHQDKGITYFSESDINIKSLHGINIGKPLENSDDQQSLQIELHTDMKTELVCGLSSITMQEGRTESVALDIIEVIE